MPWYQGPSIMNLLETIHVSADRNFVDLRFPIQYVSRPDLNFRGYAGRVASGVLRKGEKVVALPSGKSSTVTQIETSGNQVNFAFPPQSVMVTLEDEIDISRGDMLVRQNNQPHMGRHFEAMLVWMDETDMDPKQQFIIKHTSQRVKARIDEVRYEIDVNTTHRSETSNLKLNQIGRVVLTTSRPLLFDSYSKNRQTGSFILIDPVSNNTTAVGMIVGRVDSEQLPSRITPHSSDVLDRSIISQADREKQLDQKAQTYWITGLHASGKNELAYKLEKTLFDQGKTVIVLDGNQLRTRLNQELGFNKADRDENIRRVAEIAKLLNDQGLVVIAVFLSPDSDTRTQVREMIGDDRFKEIFVNTPLEVCRKRDKKGLYQKADEGKIQHFPGVDMEYETGTADIEISDIESVDISDLI
jgi:bifunctional enzyme CysN/CysC